MADGDRRDDPESQGALLRLAARLNALHEVDEVLAVVCEELALTFDVPIATANLRDASGDHLRPAATVGLSASDRERLAPFPVAELEQALAMFGDSIYVVDLQELPRPNPALYRELEMRSMAAAPLRHHGELLGLISVTSRGAPRPFHESDLALLRGMADLAATALQSARLFAENDAQLRALRALYTGVHRLVADLDLDGVARSITRACGDTPGVKLAWIGLAEAGGTVRPITHAPSGATYPFAIAVRWDEGPEADGPTGRAIRTRVPAHATDLDAEPTFAPWSDAARAAGLRSSLALPLLSRDHVLGALNLYSDQVQFFSPARTQFFCAFADLAAAALDNARSAAERRELDAKLQFAERMVSIGTLAAGVAHEINNPLASVMANLEHALASLRSTPVNPTVMAALDDALLGALRVRDIVRDLKTFSRGDDERRAPLDVRRVVDFAIRMASGETTTRARVTRTFEEVPEVLGNEARLGQVFVNLIVNAAQSIEPGSAAENEIHIAVRRDADGVAIDVRDTGCGIAPEALGRIFDPFFTTKPLGVGTGLGLSICHGIVKDHGGTIGVESTVGKGSCFTVRLPAAETPAP